MSTSPQDRDRGLYHDMRLERREWRIERVGAVLLMAFLIAAVLGVFGNGPLSRDQRRAGELEVLYQRFARAGSPTALDVSVGPGGHGAGPVEVLVSADYLDAVRVESVFPEPDSVSLTPGFQAFRFTVQPGAELRVSFAVQGEDIGSLEGTVRVGRASVTFSQFVYP